MVPVGTESAYPPSSSHKAATKSAPAGNKKFFSVYGEVAVDGILNVCTTLDPPCVVCWVVLDAAEFSISVGSE
jgi:hypothetical protein